LFLSFGSNFRCINTNGNQSLAYVKTKENRAFWKYFVSCKSYFYLQHHHVQWRIFSQNFGWITILVNLFVQKCQVVSLIFFKSQFVRDFLKIDVLWYFSLNFLKRKKDLSSKIDTRIMSITPTNQIIILIQNFNFNEKSNSRNLIKMTKLHHFFKNRNKIETKKIKRPTWYFWTKIEIKRIISNILYKLVKT